MSARWAVVALVALVLHPVAHADAIKGDVLVWGDAKLYVAPSTTAAFTQIFDFGSKSRDDMLGHVMAWHVAGMRGDFIDITPTTSEQCSWLRYSDDTLDKLHLFVRREDLAPVITKKVSRTFPDGTSFTLEPGVAVAGDGKSVSFIGERVELRAAHARPRQARRHDRDHRRESPHRDRQEARR